jgi:hypothetical protein
MSSRRDVEAFTARSPFLQKVALKVFDGQYLAYSAPKVGEILYT